MSGKTKRKRAPRGRTYGDCAGRGASRKLGGKLSRRTSRRPRSRWESASEREARRRLRLAVSVLLVAGGILLILCLATQALESAGSPSVIGEALSIASEVGGGDESDEDGSLTSLLAALEDAATSGDEVPESFQEEAFSLEGFTELRCDLDSGVLGFTAEGEAAEVFEGITAALEEGGWTFVESGLDACGTFAKTTGDYQWLFMSCVQVGGFTSVVVQVDSFA